MRKRPSPGEACLRRLYHLILDTDTHCIMTEKISPQQAPASQNATSVPGKGKRKQRYNKWSFIRAFAITMALFAIVRHAFSIDVEIKKGSIRTPAQMVAVTEHSAPSGSVQADPVPSRPQTRVRGVYSYAECFPDTNDLQLSAAQANGIEPMRSRSEAEQHKKNLLLVCVAHSPFYYVEDLKHSIPYLVPKAQQLLNEIGFNFADSLAAKRLTPHILIITSVLRTEEDVENLQHHNRNATERSCHCYGTTLDISYNRFIPINADGDGLHHITRYDENLKRVLSEVLRDLREAGRCYVKYERKQGCFHLTVR